MSRAAQVPQIPGYAILNVLGRGGMGIVVKARHRALNRLVAIKLPLREMAPDADDRARFLREARSAARLRHPHICPIHEVGEVDGRPFLAMGYIEGQTLDVWSDAQKPAQHQIAALVASLARAVGYAHEHGVIHRDLKPSNVLVDSETSAPVLMDFGLAKELAEAHVELTQSGQIMGTPAFMSPEQAAGRTPDIGPATDVYALGAILYRLLSGCLPFQGTTGEVLRKVQLDEPVPPRKFNKNLHRDLETICLKTMSKERGQRYASAIALAEDLERYVAGDPILARRQSLPVRLLRKARKHPLVAGLAATVVLAIAALAVLGIVVRQRQQSSERLAQAAAAVDELPWSENNAAELERRVQRLAELDARRAETAQRAITARIEELATQTITRPRLSETDVAAAERLIERLAAREKAAADALRHRLSVRLGSWDTLFQLAAPYAELPAVFPPGTVTAGPMGLTRQSDSERLLRTRVTQAGPVRLDAVFAENWTSAAEIGLALNVDQSNRYEVRLLSQRPGAGVKDPPTFAEARQTGGRPFLAIYRNTSALRLRELAAAELPLGKLKLAARREGHRLVVHVNDVAVEFDDLFPLPENRPAAFGLIWPAAVGIERLTAQRWLAPVEPSPLQQGDGLFSEGNFTGALQSYQEQSSAARDAEILQEVRFKQALCLLQLKRPAEAEPLLSTIAHEAGDRWPAAAACQWWLLLIRQKRLAEAEDAYQTVANRYRFEDLAVMVSEEDRRQIRDAYGYTGQFRTIAQILRPNPQRVREMERVMQMEELLDPTSTAARSARLHLARAHRLLGDEARALELVNALPHDTPVTISYLEEICWILRRVGKADEALVRLEAVMLDQDKRVRESFVRLLLERAKIYVAQEKRTEAERDLEEYRRVDAAKLEKDLSNRTDVALFLGLLRQRRGDQPGALEAWHWGALSEAELKQPGFTHGTIWRAMVLAVLTDTLTETVAQNLWARVPGGSESDSPLSVFAKLLLPQIQLNELTRAAWTSPRGRQFTEGLSYQSIGLDERYHTPIVIMIAEVIRQQAFRGELNADQESLVNRLAEDAFRAVVEQGTVTQVQLLPLALAWKSSLGVSGWTSAAQTLDPSIRGPLNYVLAHRMLSLGSQPQALSLLDAALADLPADSSSRALAEQDRSLVAAGKGQLMLVNEHPRPVELTLRRGDGTTARVEVDRSRSLVIPAGEYAIDLLESGEKVQAVASRVVLQPAARHVVEVKWLWRPGPAESVLAGLVPRPTALPELGRWQVETVMPRAEGWAIAWSPDGERIAFGDRTGAIRVFHANSNRLLHILLGHQMEVTTLAWSPDSATLASASWDGSVRLWDSAGVCRHTLVGHGNAVSYVGWRPDGQQLASTSADVRLWNADGTPGSVLRGVGWTRCVVWCQDNTLVITGGDDGKVHLWNAADGKLIRSVDTQLGRIEDLAWSPDATRLFVGGNLGSESKVLIEAFNADVDASLAAWTPPIGRVTCIQPTRDGKHLATTSGGRVVLLGAESGELISQNKAAERQSNVFKCALSPDGRIVDNCLRIWRRDGDQVTIEQALGKARYHYALAWHPTEEKLALPANDGKLRIWDVNQRAANIVAEGPDQWNNVAWSPDGQWIATSAYYNVTNNYRTRLFRPDGSPGPRQSQNVALSSLAFSPDSTTLAGGGIAGGVYLWKLDDKPPVKLDEPTARVFGVAWSPEGQRMAAVSGKVVHVWNAGGTLEQAVEATGLPLCLCWSPDGTQLAYGTGSRTTFIWDLVNKPKGFRSHDFEVFSIAWRPDSKMIASGGRDATIRLFYADGKPGPVLRCPAGIVQSVAWKPDGKTLAALSGGTLQIWDTEAAQPTSTSVLLPDDRSVTFGPGGEVLQGDLAAAERDLVYLVEQPGGSLQVLTPSEFSARLQSAANSKPTE